MANFLYINYTLDSLPKIMAKSLKSKHRRKMRAEKRLKNDKKVLKKLQETVKKTNIVLTPAMVKFKEKAELIKQEKGLLFSTCIFIRLCLIYYFMIYYCLEPIIFYLTNYNQQYSKFSIMFKPLVNFP